MANPIETTEVAAVLVLDAEGSRVLADFNRHWHCFSVPMSKRHPLVPTHEDDTTVEEPLEATAVRAVTEVLGRPLLPRQTPKRLPVDVPPYARSGRDGTWKRYQYHVFAVRIDHPPRPLDGHAAVWLTPAEVEAGEPVSPTARDILRAIPFEEVRKVVGL